MMPIVSMSDAPAHYLDPDYVEPPIVPTILYKIVCCVLLRYNNSEVSSELLNEDWGGKIVYQESWLIGESQTGLYICAWAR